MEEEVSEYIEREFENSYGISIWIEPDRKEFHVSVSWERGFDLPDMESKLGLMATRYGLKEPEVRQEVKSGDVMNSVYTVKSDGGCSRYGLDGDRKSLGGGVELRD